jgi:hypothetical protein
MNIAVLTEFEIEMMELLDRYQESLKERKQEILMIKQLIKK